MSSLSIKEQIAQLERQRAEELRRISDLYSRTQHDMARSVSPTRFVRKHLGAMLALAAVAGLVLAPAPHRKKTKDEERPGRRGRRSTVERMASLAFKWLPGWEKFIPEAIKSKLHQSEPRAEDRGGRYDADQRDQSPASRCCEPENRAEEAKATAAGRPKAGRHPDSVVNEVVRSVLTTFLARADIKGFMQQLAGQVKAGLRNPRRARTMDASGGATISTGDVGTVREDETL